MMKRRVTRKKIDKAKAETEKLIKKFRDVQIRQKISFQTKDWTQQGESADNPAEDCYVIQAKNEKAVSGFYWIMPICAPDPIRVYCEMKTGSAIMLRTRNSPGSSMFGAPVSSVRDIQMGCAEIGLQPLMLKQRVQLEGLQEAIKEMGFLETSPGYIPLAHDYGCDMERCQGKYKDLADGTVAITSLLISTGLNPLSPGIRTSNTAGIGPGGETALFDIGSDDIVGIVCSTNTMQSSSILPHVDITCQTTARDNPVFTGMLNTNIVVSCPAGCEDEESVNVYGSNNVYSDSSSICRAAIHAGIMRNGGLVNVSIESPRTSYDGSIANGIQSHALNKSMKPTLVNIIEGKSLSGDVSATESQVVEKSIRIGPLARGCPIDALVTSSTSFLETSASERERVGSEVELGLLKSSEETLFDPSVAAKIERMLKKIDEQYGVDPFIVVAGQQAASKAVQDARKILKPAEKLQRTLRDQGLDMLMEIQSVGNRLYDASGMYYGKLDRLNSALELAKQMRIPDFSDWKLLYEEMSFSETFGVYDSGDVRRGPGVWGYSGVPIAGRSAAISQTSPITGRRQGFGTFALLTNKNFFDSRILVDVYPSTKGDIGIMFRARDQNNGYLFVLSHTKRLYQLEDGKIILLAEEDDGGILPGKWTKVEIFVQAARIQISTAVGDEELKQSITVLAERFMSGTVGLFSSGIEGAFFDEFKIEALECINPKIALPPAPPRCSIFKETYYGSVNGNYTKIDSPDAPGPNGRWEYKDAVGGRDKVLAQVNAVTGRSGLGSIVVLKGQRLCDNGFLSFDVLGECTGGIVGGVFHHQKPGHYQTIELTPTEFRLRNVTNGMAETLADVPANFEVGKWHHIMLNFEGGAIVGTLTYPDGRTSMVKYEDLVGSMPKRGQIGLLSWNCGGSAFDKIQLSPYNVKSINNKQNFVSFIKTDVVPWNVCASTVHLLSRKKECSQMLASSTSFRKQNCVDDFCEECCDYHTSLLPQEQKNECIKSCNKNKQLTNILQNHFLQYLEECLDKQAPNSDHCDANDEACYLESCHLCCASSQTSEELELIPQNLLRNSGNDEIGECKYQCSKKYNLFP